MSLIPDEHPGYETVGVNLPMKSAESGPHQTLKQEETTLIGIRLHNVVLHSVVYLRVYVS